MKICSKCGIEKFLEDFHKDKQKYDGRYSSCKNCTKEISKTAEYKEKRKHPRYNVIQKRFRAKKFGLTLEQYELMFNQQNNRCAICNKHQSELRIVLGVDHCHKTGKVRGLLCDNCNRGIGFLKDSPDILIKAAKYVIKNY